MNTAALLLVFLLLIGAVAAGTITARQARRLPVTGGPTGAIPPRGGSVPADPDVSYRPAPHRTKPPVENDEIFRAVTAALEAHGKRADRKALYSNILFFAAGVLASILTTLLVHPL